MGKTKDLGHLAHIVAYDGSNHITVPAGITMHTNQLVASQSYVTTALGSYALSSSLGSYVPTSRTITINGTTLDLSANRSFTIAAGLTSFNTRTGAITLTSGDVTGALGFTPVTNARTLTINGTSFDLSADRSFTVSGSDSTKLPLSGGTISGLLTISNTGAPFMKWRNSSATNYSLIGFYDDQDNQKVWFGMGGRTQSFGSYSAYSTDGLSMNLDGGGAINISNRGTSKVINLNTGTENTSNFTTLRIANMAVSINPDSGGGAVLHAGNYSSYALPLTGGTVNGVIDLGPNSGSNNGIGIKYGSTGYGRIRFYQDSNENHSTIHSFGGSWGGGFSTGCINIDGQSGVTLGAWNNPDMKVNKNGSVYARGYRGSDNVGGTGEASWHPAGAYIGGTMWQYGGMYKNNTAIHDVMDIYNRGWFRNYGDSGLYNQDYGCHLARNSQSSHGSWTMFGYTKAGYVGLNLQDPQGFNNNLMFEQGRGGVYQENGGGWHFYYDRPNDCLGLSGSETYDWVRAVTNGKHRITNDTWCDAISYAAGFSNISDGRFKENVITIDSALDKILQLRGVYYNWIIDTEQQKHIGVIAQEVAEVLPEAVIHHEETDTYTVSYNDLSGVFIEGVKELNQKLTDANSRIELLETKLNELLNA